MGTGRRIAVREATLVIDPAFAIADVDDRVFGSFVEHMGRCVYGGIYERDGTPHPGRRARAGARARRDDRALPGRQLRLGLRLGGRRSARASSGRGGSSSPGARSRPTWSAPTSSWPGRAPPARSRCSRSTWARAAWTPPARLVEYCNAPRGTEWADRRPVEEPYGVPRVVHRQRDGRAVADRPQGRGRPTASWPTRPARRCGSSTRRSSSSCAAARTRGCRRSAPGRTPSSTSPGTSPTTSRCTPTSTRRASRPPRPSSAASLELDRMIDTVAATADAVAGRKRSRRRVSLSVDEWNVWYQSRARPGARDRPFEHAPPLIEDTYTVTDALVVGCTLITLLRHADRVKMACLAQLVNVIAPIRTLDGGPAWRQTTFFPFRDAARHGRGTVLRVEPDGADLPDRGRRGRARAGGDRRPRRGHADAVRRQPRHRAAGARRRSCAARRACSSTPRWPTRTRAAANTAEAARPGRPARARPAPGSTASGCARRCRRGPGTCCACASDPRLTVVSLPTAGP